MIIKYKRLHPHAKMPRYAHPGDAGMDLFAIEPLTLEPGERKVVPLGFSLELEEGYAAIVKDKSGLAKEHGLHNLAGVCDAGYRGEYSILLINLGDAPVSIAAGQKIAQLVILAIPQVEMIESEELAASARADGGFGSTGKF